MLSGNQRRRCQGTPLLNCSCTASVTPHALRMRRTARLGPARLERPCLSRRERPCLSSVLAVLDINANPKPEYRNQEAMLLQNLDHPNIVQFVEYSVDEKEGQSTLLLVTELCEGTTPTKTEIPQRKDPPRERPSRERSPIERVPPRNMFPKERERPTRSKDSPAKVRPHRERDLSCLSQSSAKVPPHSLRGTRVPRS